MRKYQQGGQAEQEQQQFFKDLIDNQIISQEQLQQVMSDPNSQQGQQMQQVLAQLFQIWQKGGIDAVVQALQQQQKAYYGAKLNYIKWLNGTYQRPAYRQGGQISRNVVYDFYNHR